LVVAFGKVAGAPRFAREQIGGHRMMVEIGGLLLCHVGLSKFAGLVILF
jgi:hypothetical protein